jgi:hypothetical protein
LLLKFGYSVDVCVLVEVGGLLLDNLLLLVKLVFHLIDLFLELVDNVEGIEVLLAEIGVLLDATQTVVVLG